MANPRIQHLRHIFWHKMIFQEKRIRKHPGNNSSYCPFVGPPCYSWSLSGALSRVVSPTDSHSLWFLLAPHLHATSKLSSPCMSNVFVCLLVYVADVVTLLWSCSWACWPRNALRLRGLRLSVPRSIQPLCQPFRQSRECSA